MLYFQWLWHDFDLAFDRDVPTQHGVPRAGRRGKTSQKDRNVPNRHFSNSSKTIAYATVSRDYEKSQVAASLSTPLLNSARAIFAIPPKKTEMSQIVTFQTLQKP